MKKLYAFVINGKMYYFMGAISDSLLEYINLCINQIDDTSNNFACDDFCLYLKEKIGIVLNPIEISYVFRKIERPID